MNDALWSVHRASLLKPVRPHSSVSRALRFYFSPRALFPLIKPSSGKWPCPRDCLRGRMVTGLAAAAASSLSAHGSRANSQTVFRPTWQVPNIYSSDTRPFGIISRGKTTGTWRKSLRCERSLLVTMRVTRGRRWAVGLQNELCPASSGGLPPSSLRIWVTVQTDRPKCDRRQEGLEATGPRREPGTRSYPGGPSGRGTAATCFVEPEGGLPVTNAR